MTTIRNILLILAGIVLLAGLLGWLVFNPAEIFYILSAGCPAAATIPLPDGLPGPVDRFYREVYGDEIPVIDTAVIQGRSVIKPFMNIPIPARFVFVHNAAGYRHYFEPLCWVSAAESE